MDADLEQLPRKRSLDTNLNAERSSSSVSSEKISSDLSHGDVGNSNAKNVGEPNGVLESVEVSAESEQATYASANNDLKGTKAYQEADVPGLYNLAMAIIDYRGHRVVAQVHIIVLYWFFLLFLLS